MDFEEVVLVVVFPRERLFAPGASSLVADVRPGLQVDTAQVTVGIIACPEALVALGAGMSMIRVW